MYETKRITWILGAAAGAALALMLMLAGEAYVRVAQTVAPYGVDIVKLETVTITGQKRAAKTAGAAGAAAAGATIGSM